MHRELGGVGADFVTALDAYGHTQLALGNQGAAVAAWREAAALAERVRTQLHTRDGGSEPSFTVSLGVAEGNHVEDLNEVFAAADRALFAAKAAGRDRVIVAGKDGTIPLQRTGAAGA